MPILLIYGLCLLARLTRNIQKRYKMRALFHKTLNCFMYADWGPICSRKNYNISGPTQTLVRWLLRVLLSDVPLKRYSDDFPLTNVVWPLTSYLSRVRERTRTHSGPRVSLVTASSVQAFFTSSVCYCCEYGGSVQCR
jgi:hypothetical protein